jgi:hypothetical protein
MLSADWANIYHMLTQKYACALSQEGERIELSPGLFAGKTKQI